MVLQVAGVRQGYRVRKRPGDLVALCSSLDLRFQKREANDIARVAQVLAFARGKGCLTQALLDYFGETRGECGHCCRCEDEPVQPIPAREPRPIEGIGRDQLESLRQDGNGALDTPRQLARFLCGISSPATTKAKMRGHSLFGVLEPVPFSEVLEFVEPLDSAPGSRKRIRVH